MIHSDVIKSLTEDEATLLHAVAGFIYQRIGYTNIQYRWVQMLRTDRLIHILNKLANLKEEYHATRDSLIAKIKDGGGF
jgi:hypothetical protein